jgi:predicted nucleic acid-binding protein
MIVLDTNVISEVNRPRADAAVEAWLAATPGASLHLCSPVIMELAYGGERFLGRTGSTRYIEALEQALVRFRGKILQLDAASGRLAGQLLARCENRGRALDTPDAMIAAIAIVHGATLATRNVRDFEKLGVKLVNPFEARP